MTARLFDSVSFEASKLPTITSGTVFSGFPPVAFSLGQADDWQGYLLYKGPANSIVAGNVIDNTFIGSTGASGYGSCQVAIPPFATHVQIGAVASGTGTITITWVGTDYVINIENPATTTDPDDPTTMSVTFGPSDAAGISLGISTGGHFAIGQFSVVKESTVNCAALIFRWYRRSTTL
jgi:hypothetical protein